MTFSMKIHVTIQDYRKFKVLTNQPVQQYQEQNHELVQTVQVPEREIFNIVTWKEYHSFKRHMQYKISF